MHCQTFHLFQISSTKHYWSWFQVCSYQPWGRIRTFAHCHSHKWCRTTSCYLVAHQWCSLCNYDRCRGRGSGTGHHWSFHQLSLRWLRRWWESSFVIVDLCFVVFLPQISEFVQLNCRPAPVQPKALCLSVCTDSMPGQSYHSSQCRKSTAGLSDSLNLSSTRAVRLSVHLMCRSSRSFPWRQKETRMAGHWSCHHTPGSWPLCRHIAGEDNVPWII